MNIEQQRKAFDEWYGFKPKGQAEEVRYNTAWRAWLAAQQQEGYVMVPVEPTDGMWSNGIDAYADAMSENKILKASSIVDIYKAMIQAAQE